MSLPPPIPLAEAQARLLAMAAPLGSEEMPAEAAAGRYLAEALAAARTQPPADLSAMDGYAVRADELAGPWRVVGESAAGHPFAGVLGKGEAARISTGAIMPEGAGAILLQENAAREGDDLRLSGADQATPRHIRRKGFDFATGDALLGAGGALGAAQIALAIAAGHGSVPVGQMPHIAILDSGDELAADPMQAAEHQIPASNGPMLAAMAAPLASKVSRIGPVVDRMEALAEALAKAESADLVVTSGGASVGDHDLIRPALEAWGAEISFWRVAIKPGKPLLVARRGAQIVLGLPGNPVSAYVTAFLFMLPLLRRMAGSASPLPDAIPMRLSAPCPGTGPRAEFFRAIATGCDVMPISQRDSSALASLAAANALIARPAGCDEAATGELVEVYPLQNGGKA